MYSEWVNFLGVPVFVFFVEGPIHEFQIPQEIVIFSMNYEGKYMDHEFWTPRMHYSGGFRGGRRGLSPPPP